MLHRGKAYAKDDYGISEDVEQRAYRAVADMYERAFTKVRQLADGLPGEVMSLHVVQGGEGR